MIDLHELIQNKGQDWVERNLLVKRDPRELDREALIDLMVLGLSPTLAAKEYHATSKSPRGLQGLRWLAYEVEEQMFIALGCGLDTCLNELIKHGSVDMVPSRVQRLVKMAKRSGINIEIVTTVRIK